MPVQNLSADNGHVQLEIVDVLAGQQATFSVSADPERQRQIAAVQVAEPLRFLWKPMLENPWVKEKPPADDPVSAIQMLNIYPLDGNPLEALRYLDLFHQAGSLAACRDALVRTFDMLRPGDHGITLPSIRFTLALADPDTVGLIERNEGYTGIGGMPGAIMIIAIPNDYNLPRLAAMAAHEAHHNVRLTYEPWNPATITVGQYLILEGLAEAFAAELYGEDKLGPWAATKNTLDVLEQHRPTMRAAIERTGDPRPYMFGDWAASFGGYEPIGLPDFIGYGTGYQIVTSYLKATGLSATEATWKPWREIAAGSPWLQQDEGTASGRRAD